MYFLMLADTVTTQSQFNKNLVMSLTHFWSLKKRHCLHLLQLFLLAFFSSISFIAHVWFFLPFFSNFEQDV